MDHSVRSYLERLSTEKLELIFREFSSGEDDKIYEAAWKELLMVLQKRQQNAAEVLHMEMRAKPTENDGSLLPE